MAVFTDGKHLIAYSNDELHTFAKKIGLKREWFQNHRIPHYDLFKSKRELARAFGAIFVDSRTLFLEQVICDYCPYCGKKMRGKK